MYCKKCNVQYRDNFIICADCGSKLIESPRSTDTTPLSIKPDIINGNPILLASFSDKVQMDLLVVALKNNGIFPLVKPRGNGAYMEIITGFSVFGYDVFVLQPDFEMSKEIYISTSCDVQLDNQLDVCETYNMHSHSKNPDNSNSGTACCKISYQRRKTVFKWLLRLGILSVVLLVVFLIVIDIMR